MKKTRTPSDETEMRRLLATLTDLVVEMKEEARKNNIVMLARLKGIDDELSALSKADKSGERKLVALATLTADTNAKVIDLHVKLIGEANQLGERIYDLEKERGKRGGSRRISRPPGR